MKITSSNGPAPTGGSRRKIAIALAAVAAAALLFAGQATAKPGKERERHGRPERPSVETTTTIAAVPTTTVQSNTTLITRPTTTTTTTSTTTGGGPECGPRWKVEGPGCVPCDPSGTSTTQAGGTCAPPPSTTTTTATTATAITTTAIPTTTIVPTAVPITTTTTEVPEELAVPNPWEEPNHGCTEGSYWYGNGCVSDGRVWR